MPESDVQPSLRRRIYRMSGVMVGLIVISSVIGVWGQSRLMTNFSDAERYEQTLSRFATLDHDVERLRSRANSYLHTGGDIQFDATLSILDELAQRIGELRGGPVASEFAEPLESMQRSLDTFETHLKRAADERRLRQSLVMVDLPAQAEQVGVGLEQIRDLIQAAPDSDAQFRDELLELDQSHHSSVESLQSYFILPDSVAFDRALQSIRRSRRLARQLTERIDSETSLIAQRQIDAQLVEFKRLATRAVQATRGYMYFINVVMAGEVSEFAYYSDRIQQLAESRREQSRQSRLSSARRSRWFGFWASLMAIGLAIGMATRLSYAIVSPITKMTDVFRRLGQGRTVDEIPALTRQDEIGRMARAAQVFNDKNRETTELLLRSQRLAEELADQADQLEKTNAELDSFAYVASHDLKSPLRGISHLTSWIEEDWGNAIPMKVGDHLQQIRGRIGRMNSLLDDLLEYSRAGRSEPKVERVDIGSMIDHITSLLLMPDGFTVRQCTPNLDFNTYKAPLIQVLLNLLSNSVKYNDKGREGRVEVSAVLNDQRVEFAVEDNGRGIAEIYHDRVFEMYQRVAVDVAEGTGMGLAIVAKHVEAYGGRVKLISDEGRGSTFQFSWPMVTLPHE
ncbi:MAG: ATP-binding protein [Planctomycetota bacterium]